MQTHEMQAYSFTELFNTEELAANLASYQSSIDPLSAIHLDLGENKKVFVLNFGSIVFFNIPKEEHQNYISQIINKKEIHQYEATDSISIIEGGKNAIEFHKVYIDKLTTDRAEVIASALAQSTTMEYYESILENSWITIDKMLAKLKKTGSLTPFPHALTQKTAECLIVRGKVVRILHLLDKPDLIWEDKVMDENYNDLRSLFDLPERFQALEYKLQLIQQTLELLVDTSRDRRLFWLELIIVILIAVEIVISLSEKILA